MGGDHLRRVPELLREDVREPISLLLSVAVRVNIVNLTIYLDSADRALHYLKSWMLEGKRRDEAIICIRITEEIRSSREPSHVLIVH